MNEEFDRFDEPIPLLQQTAEEFEDLMDLYSGFDPSSNQQRQTSEERDRTIRTIVQELYHDCGMGLPHSHEKELMTDDGEDITKKIG